MNVYEIGRHLSFASVENDQIKSIEVGITQKNDEKKGKSPVLIQIDVKQFQGEPLNFSVQQDLE